MTTCTNCGRPDCGLLADVIVGTRALWQAVRDCYRARWAKQPKGKR